MSAQTFEVWDGALSGGSSGTEQHRSGAFETTSTSSTAASTSGPTLSFVTADGTEFVVDGETLLVLLALAQTLMLAYVTVSEVMD